MTDAPDYANVAAALKRLGFTDEASEFHGALCGALCLQTPLELDLAQLSAASEPPRLGADAHARDTLERLRDLSHEMLQSSEMEFAPLLPDDEDPLVQRVQALADWCQGFLYGLSLLGFDLKSCSEEVREIIGDFSQFTNAGAATGDDEELEENAYAELVEYLRVGAQIVFMELHPREPGPPDADEPAPTLH